MKKLLIVPLALSLLATSVAAQTSLRQRPMGTTTTVPKTTPQAVPRQLDPAIVAARMRPAPSFIPVSGLRNFGAIIIGEANAPFTVTPLNQTIAGKGSLSIRGDISAPNPAPPGFPGQAILRYYMMGFATSVWENGVVNLSIQAKANKYYAVDCLAVVDGGRVNFVIRGNETDFEGKTDPKDGHLFFNVRRTNSDGPITIIIHPDQLIQEARNPLQPNFISERNVMDFWGCQVTPSG
jgi:hypothetical protein